MSGKARPCGFRGSTFCAEGNQAPPPQPPPPPPASPRAQGCPKAFLSPPGWRATWDELRTRCSWGRWWIHFRVQVASPAELPRPFQKSLHRCCQHRQRSAQRVPRWAGPGAPQSPPWLQVEQVASSHGAPAGASRWASSSAHTPRDFKGAEWPRISVAGRAVCPAQAGCVQRHTGAAPLGSPDAFSAFRDPQAERASEPKPSARPAPINSTRVPSRRCPSRLRCAPRHKVVRRDTGTQGSRRPAP